MIIIIYLFFFFCHFARNQITHTLLMALIKLSFKFSLFLNRIFN